jgi:hypothetical protein
MLNDERIRVLIAHNNPLIAAGLEAAFSTQQGFHIVGCRDTDDASLLDAAAVAVTDFEGGTQRLAARYGGGCRVLILSDDDSGRDCGPDFRPRGDRSDPAIPRAQQVALLPAGDRW